ncbi:hypothetical protein [Stutzerimonas stutzeri]|uniref:hypothetical protein n=1 Tax=Stutzerimonas stutzeri TaxID=316 RepID=UPI00265D5CB1|nr:hypothetical protein [Stutzerimonas stutzeri]MCF6783421.1 hypothetical protein [Stutzerimonas stutzeri]
MAEVRVGTVSDALLFGKLMTWGWYSNPKLREPGMRILSRSQFKCESCGFKSLPSRQVQHGYMVPVDRGHPGLIALTSAGECLCPLCASALGLNWSVVGLMQSDKSVQAPGLLIHQPVLSQVEINRIALHVISASSSQGSISAIASAARDIDASMTALNQELGTFIRFYRGRDSDFARALALIPVELYEQRQEILGHLRWWPNVKFWSKQGAYWMQATYAALQDSDRDLQELLSK